MSERIRYWMLSLVGSAVFLGGYFLGVYAVTNVDNRWAFLGVLAPAAVIAFAGVGMNVTACEHLDRMKKARKARAS